jgi:hypothetical protein
LHRSAAFPEYSRHKLLPLALAPLISMEPGSLATPLGEVGQKPPMKKPCSVEQGLSLRR